MYRLATNLLLFFEKESSDSDNSAKVKSSAREESTMDSFPETFRKKKVKTEPKEHTEVDHNVEFCYHRYYLSKTMKICKTLLNLFLIFSRNV
jgi:hypothetical protein